MLIDDAVLKPEERAAFALRGLYAAKGYRRYKMSKFEEYDLYVKNKEFLISDSVITFTDTNGRLMALKPDVTLSIIRNTKDAQTGAEKVYYHENVYRVSKSTRRFQEIPQTGLECIGEVGQDEICEVIGLAARSLQKISPRSVLDLSHLGIVGAVLEEAGFSAEDAQTANRLIGEKNRHELRALCEKAGAPADATEKLLHLAALYGEPETVLGELNALLAGTGAENAMEELAGIMRMLKEDPAYPLLRIDFSVSGNLKYYNGMVFKGFVEGIPGSVLSGGQYDALMRRMHRNAGAIGFAVYLDALERLQEGGNDRG